MNNVDESLPGKPSFLNCLGRMVKLLDDSHYIDRLGYLIAPRLIITSLDVNEGKKPESKEFIYNSNSTNMVQGTIDTSENGYFHIFKSLKLAIMSTAEEHNVGFEKLKEQNIPMTVAILAATKDSPCTQLFHMTDVHARPGGFITYDGPEMDLDSSSSGGLILEPGTWVTVGIHLRWSPVKKQGTGILLNSLIHAILLHKPAGLDKFGDLLET